MSVRLEAKRVDMRNGWAKLALSMLVAGLFAFPSDPAAAVDQADCLNNNSLCHSSCKATRPYGSPRLRDCVALCDLILENCESCVDNPGYHSAQFCKDNGAALNPPPPPPVSRPPIAAPGGTVQQ